MTNRPFSILAAFALAAAPFTFADEHGELIFEDDFERSESQETKDEPGNGWGTNSEKRAKGDKQVDLRDGAMYIFISPKADHGVSVTHEAEFKDGAVGMRFMLEDAKDSLGLNFADLKYKKVHAGHICAARIHTHQVQLQDLKTGNMDLAVRTARLGDGLSEEQKAMLKKKSTTVKNKVSVGEWHDLLVKIAGDTMTVTIDGKEVGSFTSEGITHDTKRTLRLAVPKDAVVDDIKIWRSK